jgi:DUF4097 and DUF4098 domain-containing protein YvlB
MTLDISLALSLISSLAALAETEEKLNQRFTVQPERQLVVDVDFGSIDVATHETDEVVVDVRRKITRKNRADEEEFLKDHPVTFSQDGDTVTVRSRRNGVGGWSSSGRSRTEAKYTVQVPAQFNTQLKTSGGGIAVSDLVGEVKANTSGGGLSFVRVRGPLDAVTSGGGIRLSDCEGDLKIRTSGGGIDVSGGSGSLDGHTSGGSVTVKAFEGDARVDTSGGGLTIENVIGPVAGSTSGGSVSAVLPSPLPGDVKLSTSAGGVTVVVQEDAAFDLDASTSAGRVSTELPVMVVGEVARDRLHGTVNGGGKSVVLRSSAGSIHLKKP